MALSLKDIKLLEKNKKARDQQGLFVTEGIKLFSEAPKENIAAVCLSKSFSSQHPEIFSEIPSGAQLISDIGDDRFEGLSDTRSPQGILTVLRKIEFARESVFAKDNPLFLVLENLQDPGNAGTILRTAEAAGADAVFLTEGAVDLYNPKTIRSTMGSIYRVPHFYIKDLTELLEKFMLGNILTYAAHLNAEAVYTAGDYKKGTAFLIGNESRGLTDELADRADRLIKIPMSGSVESLNAGMAAGILMYEAKRQREFQTAQ